MKVLIVDDTPTNLRLLRAVLEGESFEVVEASDGLQALAILEREPVDAIISDILMPNMDGYRFCHEVRRSERLHHLPFIIYSSTYNSPADEKLALDMGADKYIKKPAPIKEIAGALDEIIRRGPRPRPAPVPPQKELNLAKLYNETLVNKLEQKNEELSVSEEKFRQLAENISEVCFIISADLSETLYINPAYEKIWGRTCRSAYENPASFMEGIHEADHARVLAAVEGMRRGEKYDLEYRVVLPDGQIRSVHARGAAIRNESGVIYRLAGIAEDITPRKQAEAELHAAHSQLRQLLDHSPAVLYALKVDGQKVIPHLVSENVTGLLGFTMPEVMRYEWWLGQLHPEDRDGAVASISETLTQGASLTEYRLRHKDGSYRWVEDKRQLVRDPSNQPMEIVGIWADITERKRAEEFLRKTARQKTGRQRARILKDLAVIFGLGTACFAFFYYTDVLVPPLNALVLKFKDNMDDLLIPPAILVLGFLVFSYRRWREAKSQISEHVNIEEALRTLHGELEIRVQQRTAELAKTNDTLRMEIMERKKVEAERQKLEAQFRQAQKMEGIGQLAGGVAHDFNNILAVIQMQADLLKSSSNLSAEQSEFADEISVTVQRAAALTRQLLLFSRREVFQPRDLDLSESITNTAKLLMRTLGENVRMQIKLASQPTFIHADPGMMDQVLLNLAVNARDAMPNGGQLVIETSSVEFDEFAAAQSAQARPGSFVCLTVSDSGCGIPPEILPKIFEPFFTTKGVGKGTGLGLATVFGVAQQHQGWVNVYSEVGHGTTFRIYFPRLARNTDLASAPAALTAMPGGNETILLVEDDPAMRMSVRKTLAQLGYRILEASTGVRALEVWKQNRGEIRLLLTDLVMPDGMTGKDLAQRVLQENPQLKVIYMSGYSAEVAGKDFPLKEGGNFLTKPFPASKLVQTIRENLDAKSPPPAI